MNRAFLTVLIVAGSVGACSNAPEIDEQLKQDLQAASAGSIELAPRAAGTTVVSGVEQVPRSTPRTTVPKSKAPPVPSQRAAQSQDPAPTPDPRVAQQAPASSEPAAVRPSSTPRVQPAPPGGYKTVGEVIRNAPFPIKP